jgi:hypothetical protein
MNHLVYCVSNKTIHTGFMCLQVNLGMYKAYIFASMQQPADFFCKAILPEHHRLEAPSILLV